MPTVIDSLVVTLTLDDKDYKAVLKVKKDDDLKREREEERRDKLDRERRKKQTESFREVTRAAAEFTAVLAGAKGLKDFVANTIAGDAAAGRLAKNLGLSTETLTAWQGAVRQVGGTTEDASNSLQSLVTAFQQINLTGDSPLIPYLQTLGITLSDLRDPSNTLLKLADAFSKMDPQRAQALGAGMGITPAMVNLLQQGRVEVLKTLDAQRKAGVVHEEDARKAQEVQKQLSLLNSAYSRLGNDILNEVLPPLTSFLMGLTDFAEHYPNVTKGIMSIVVALGALKGAASAVALARFLIPGLGAAAAGTEAAGAGAAVAGGGALAVGGALAPFLAAAGVLLAPNRAGLAHGAGGEDEIMAARWKRTHPGGAGGTKGQEMAGYIHDRFRAAGYDEVTTRGILAGIMAEGGGVNAVNPTSGARGIGQWLGSRKTDFARRFGHGLEKSNLREQVDFMLWELANSEAAAGGAIRGAGSDAGALQAYVTRYMRPGSGTAGDLRRGGAQLARNGGRGGAGGGSTTTIGEINIKTAATDAPGIARSIKPAVQRYSFATSANTGME